MLLGLASHLLDSDWFHDEIMILAGSRRVNPSNLIGTSGTKKSSFY